MRNISAACCTFGALLTGAITQANAAPFNLIQDGSFETPTINTFYQNYGKKPPAGDSWSGPVFNPFWIVTTNNVDIVSSKFAPGNAPAAQGNQYLDLVGYGSTGGIAQAFVTIPGKTYDLTFDYGNNPWSTSTASASVVLSELELTKTGFKTVDLIDTSITHNTSTTTNINWTGFSEVFTADSFLTALSFTETVGSNNGGVLLDAVSVQTTPLPPTWSMLLAGLLALGCYGFVRGRTTPSGLAVA
jgi:hypothetical protein